MHVITSATTFQYFGTTTFYIIILCGVCIKELFMDLTIVHIIMYTVHCVKNVYAVAVYTCVIKIYLPEEVYSNCCYNKLS